MSDWIYWVCGGIAALSVWGSVSNAREQAAREERKRVGRASRANFERDALKVVNGMADFAVVHTVQDGGSLLLTDQWFDNFAYAELRRDMTVASSLRFHAFHLTGVEFARGQKRIVSETDVNTVIKRRGGLTRAAVGAAAFGGAGAIVGAATAKGVETGTHSARSSETFADGTLRIATTSPVLPIIEMAATDAQGQKVAFGMQSAIARARQGALQGQTSFGREHFI